MYDCRFRGYGRVWLPLALNALMLRSGLTVCDSPWLMLAPLCGCLA